MSDDLDAPDDDQLSLLDGEQLSLCEVAPRWAEHWRGMPAYEHQDLQPWRSVIVHLRNRADTEDLARLLGQTITDQTKSVWYPRADIGHMAGRAFHSVDATGPRYPVYIISKGRWESRLTVKALDRIGVGYSIVVEPQEYERYASVIDPARILVLPFSNLGQGSIPARNWVWDHAAATGTKRHWILDDNIASFHRYQHNIKHYVGDGAIFRAAEDFTDRYENVAISGFNYFMFVTRKAGDIPPYYLNTRVYSCLLIRNDLAVAGAPLRWRGRYNEDTDLCIRALKAGWCTILFNAFLAWKSTTMTMAGGNTDELYVEDGRLAMAESLREQHPDIVKVTEKWGRPQHHVNYKVFRHNKLRLRPEVTVPDGTDDYGMELQVFEESPSLEDGGGDEMQEVASCDSEIE